MLYFFAFQNHLDSAIAKTLKALKTSYSLKSDSSKKHLSIPSLSLDDTPISSAPFTSKITSLPQKNQHSLKIYLISSRICTWLGLYNLTELYGQLFQAVLSLRGSLFSHCSQKYRFWSTGSDRRVIKLNILPSTARSSKCSRK